MSPTENSQTVRIAVFVTGGDNPSNVRMITNFHPPGHNAQSFLRGTSKNAASYRSVFRAVDAGTDVGPQDRRWREEYARQAKNGRYQSFVRLQTSSTGDTEGAERTGAALECTKVDDGMSYAFMQNHLPPGVYHLSADRVTDQAGLEAETDRLVKLYFPQASEGGDYPEIFDATIEEQ